jgi:intracellular sulfur oxidation DsrE/DsrF family protein
MILVRNLVLIVCLSFGLGLTNSKAQDKVVYHFDNAQAQGLKGLRNIRNQLDAEPNTVIVAVTHAAGVDLLMDGAQDESSHTLYEPLIADLFLVGCDLRFVK